MQASKRRAAVLAAYLGTFLATLDISIVNVALPSMQTALQTDIAGMQWVVNVYAIGLSAIMLSAGSVADKVGHKRCWLAGAIVFTLASWLCGVAPSVSWLLWGRALQGLSAAFLIIGALPILTHLYTDPAERAHCIGGWSAFTALALILGPLLGGVLLEQWGWQSIFLINLPLGACAIVLGAWAIPERRYVDQAAKDPIGQLLSLVILGALAYGTIAAGQEGVTGVTPMWCWAIAVVGVLAFIQVERKVTNPLIPLVLFKKPVFAVANMASFFLGFSYYSSLFFFSLYFQQVQEWSPAEAGWRMMPLFIATGCVSLCFGRFSENTKVSTLMTAGYVLIAVSMAAMMWCTVDTPYWIMGSLLLIMGVGAGFAVPGTSLTIMSMAPAELTGSVSGTMNALRQAGMTMGIALLGVILSAEAITELTQRLSAEGVDQAAHLAQQAVLYHEGVHGLSGMAGDYALSMASGFQMAMLVAGLLSGVSAVLLWLSRRFEAQTVLQTVEA
ncbi:MFS transporter [Paenalcaligenes sp. Me131]|uniref:MFS transporter n=1 Tax=Paenalcaligenes sp. Me131 TaxID=3392636 RepID=UPI003D2DBDFD